MHAFRVAAVQMAHGDALADNLARARRLLDEAHARGADLALLPEYFFSIPGATPRDLAAHAPALRRFLLDASRETGMAVAANVLEPAPEGDALLNVGLVADAGRVALAQPKVHPMPREQASGVAPGPRLQAAPVRALQVGMLVCADVLYPEAARVLALQGARLLLNPVMSPWREHDPTRAARDALFVARAYDGGAFLVKAGGFRKPPSNAAEAPPADGPRAVAGRSLVAAPWGLLAKARDDFTEELLLADLDLDALERFRKGQEAFPARQPGAYRDLVGP